MRLIKKYPNRRLYDTEVSRYITLEDVRELVLRGEDFGVEDARTHEDITRSILLQIIIEQEEEGEPIFSKQILQDIVRFYGDDLQTMISTYFETSLRMFTEQQEALREQLDDVLSGNPLGAMQKAAERNLTGWKEMQDRFAELAVASTPAARRGKGGRRRQRSEG